MTTPSFHSRIILVPISSIIVPEDRYALGDWDQNNCLEIAASLANPQSGGLINPIILSKRDNDAYQLRAGGHRLEAFKHNLKSSIPCPHKSYSNWSRIPSRIGIRFSESDWSAREDAENFLRRVIPWFIRARKIHDHHARMLQESINSDPWSFTKTSQLLDLSRDEVIQSYRIIELFLSSDESDAQSAHAVQEARSLRAAYDITKRNLDRKAETEREVRLHKTKTANPNVAVKNQATQSSSPSPQSNEGEDKSPLKQASNALPLVSAIPPSNDLPLVSAIPLLHISLRDFTESYSGPRFNLIHVDPPYSVNRDSGAFQYSRADKPKYEDDDQALWNYLDDLSIFIHKHAADSCHLIIWFPVELYKIQAFIDQLPDLFPSFRLDPTPFIWIRSGARGIAPAPGYSGRKTYEWALILSSGKRPIVKVLPMDINHPAETDDRIHESQKPFKVCRHLLSMFVDTNTIALDPTAGSGRPLQAIHSLKPKSILGIEKNEAIYNIALQDWKNYISSTVLKEEI